MLIYQKIVELVGAGETLAFARIVKQKGSTPRGTGAKMLVREDGSIIGTVGGGPLEANVIEEALDSMKKGENKLLDYDLNKDASGGLNMQCGGQVQVAIEVIFPPPHLLIAGAGHVGYVLAKFAAELDWQVTVVDDREELLTSARYPAGVKTYGGATYVAALRQAKITPNTYVVIVTKDADAAVLEEVIQYQPAYIGMIGSRRKVVLVKNYLQEKGISAQRLAQIHAPIGLNIKAETPAEIAVSILAELILLMRKGDPLQVVKWGNKENGK